MAAWGPTGCPDQKQARPLPQLQPCNALLPFGSSQRQASRWLAGPLGALGPDGPPGTRWGITATATGSLPPTRATRGPSEGEEHQPPGHPTLSVGTWPRGSGKPGAGARPAPNSMGSEGAEQEGNSGHLLSGTIPTLCYLLISDQGTGPSRYWAASPKSLQATRTFLGSKELERIFFLEVAWDSIIITNVPKGSTIDDTLF